MLAQICDAITNIAGAMFMIPEGPEGVKEASLKGLPFAARGTCKDAPETYETLAAGRLFPLRSRCAFKNRPV